MSKFADVVKGLMLNGQAGLYEARKAFKVGDVDVDWGFVPQDVEGVARGVANLTGVILEKAIASRGHAQKYLGCAGYSPKQMVELLHGVVCRVALLAHGMLMPYYKCRNPDCNDCKNMTGADWKLRKDIAFVEMLIALSAFARKQGLGEGIEAELKRIQKDSFMSSGHAPEEVQ